MITPQEIKTLIDNDKASTKKRIANRVRCHESGPSAEADKKRDG